MSDYRRLAAGELAAALQDSRATTWSRVDGLSDAQWRPPCQHGVNPVAWELAHIAWFAEFWILRGPHGMASDGRVHARHAARFAGPDEWFDSARLAHERRWSLPLPHGERLRAMLQHQLDACICALGDGSDDAALYCHRLALFHEDMHGEAFAWLRAALGYPAPAGLELPRVELCAPLHVAAGEAHIGWPPGRPGFAFDNELPQRRVMLDEYEIDAAAVTAGQFARFVESGGYDDPVWWPGDAGRWRASSPWAHPSRWRRSPQGWEVRWFDRWRPLDDEQPVIHVNAFEAEAYCRWAGRCLPSAAQWEHAATSTGMQWGATVWEWTRDPFLPYPGFEPGPYRDYSQPWFGDHRELRGGAFATHARLHDARYRNFSLPERTDVFAGFRTASAPR